MRRKEHPSNEHDEHIHKRFCEDEQALLPDEANHFFAG